MERGTLYQLRNLINRRNVTKKAKSNVNANKDFLEVCITAYIIVAVLDFQGMTDFSCPPHSPLIPPDLWMEDDGVRREILVTIASAVVDKHVTLIATFQDTQRSIQYIFEIFLYTGSD